MKQLLGKLNDAETDDALKRSKSWPKIENKLSAIINRLKPALLELGVHVEPAQVSRRNGRLYNVHYAEPDDAKGAGDDDPDDPPAADA
jgi:hypothetical protein